MELIKRLVFVSNFFNHHQKPLSDELFKKIGEGFIFIETQTMTEERRRMGWGISEYPPYVVSSGKFYNNYEEYKEIIDNAEAILFGSAPQHLLKKRIQNKRLVIRYSERPIKRKYPIWKYPFRLLSWRKINPQYKSMLLFCASGYACADYSKHFLYINRCFKWGYFPELKKYEVNTLMDSKDTKLILWCGRFINWKYPQYAIEIAKRLKKEQYDFKLCMIGTGEQKSELYDLINKYDLQNQVEMCGSMSPDKVREYMEKSGIFLFTSDFNEGWGAVLNEAMNSGCAVVASHAIGSVPYLINHGENGFIYPNGDIDNLFDRIKFLLDNSDVQKKIGEKAYDTILYRWNATIAAERLTHFVEEYENKKCYKLYEDGICSKAEIIANNWFKKKKI